MKKIITIVSVFVLMLFVLLFAYVSITKRDFSKMGLGAEVTSE